MKSQASFSQQDSCKSSPVTVTLYSETFLYFQMNFLKKPQTNSLHPDRVSLPSWPPIDYILNTVNLQWPVFNLLKWEGIPPINEDYTHTFTKSSLLAPGMYRFGILSKLFTVCPKLMKGLWEFPSSEWLVCRKSSSDVEHLPSNPSQSWTALHSLLSEHVKTTGICI